MPQSFCPATMCHLMAATKGSPWTGDVNTECQRNECAWWNQGKCSAPEHALENLSETEPDLDKQKNKIPHCPRAHECQWQQQAEWLCPPRFALINGFDPKRCNW